MGQHMPPLDSGVTRGLRSLLIHEAVDLVSALSYIELARFPYFAVRSAHSYLFGAYVFFLQLPTSVLLTPWSRVLLEKLTGSQPFKKFPTFYGIRRFITAFTSSRHLSLS